MNGYNLKLEDMGSGCSSKLGHMLSDSSGSTRKTYNEDDIQKLNAQWVAKKYSQQPSSDFNERFALVALMETVKNNVAISNTTRSQGVLVRCKIRSSKMENLKKFVHGQPHVYFVKGETDKVYCLCKVLYN